MAVVLVLVVVSLPLFNSAKVTTLDDIFLQNFDEDVKGYSDRIQAQYIQERRLTVDPNTRVVMLFTKELYEYLQAAERRILTEFSRVLAALPLQSIYDDLSQHCSEFDNVAVEDLTQKPTNWSCVQIRLKQMVTSQFKMAVDLGLRQVSRDCREERLSLCAVASLGCTQAHGGRIKRILIDQIEDLNAVEVVDRESRLSMMANVVVRDLLMLYEIYSSVGAVYDSATFLNVSSLATNPLDTAEAEDEKTWSVIKANAGKYVLPCSHYADSQNAEQFLRFLFSCFYLKLLESNAQLLRCAYSVPEARPLK